MSCKSCTDSHRSCGFDSCARLIKSRGSEGVRGETGPTGPFPSNNLFSYFRNGSSFQNTNTNIFLTFFNANIPNVNFNGTVFTAPSSGIYSFSTANSFERVVDETEQVEIITTIYLNGVPTLFFARDVIQNQSEENSFNVGKSQFVDARMNLTTGDQVQVVARVNYSGVGNFTLFSGNFFGSKLDV